LERSAYLEEPGCQTVVEAAAGLEGLMAAQQVSALTPLSALLETVPAEAAVEVAPPEPISVEAEVEAMPSRAASAVHRTPTLSADRADQSTDPARSCRLLEDQAVAAEGP
jgi:hypothetical protein